MANPKNLNDMIMETIDDLIDSFHQSDLKESCKIFSKLEIMHAESNRRHEESMKRVDAFINQANERIKHQDKQHDESIARQDERIKKIDEYIKQFNEKNTENSLKSIKSIDKQVMNFSALIVDPAEIHEDIKSIKLELVEQKTINEELREMLNDLLKMIQHFFKNMDSIPMEEEKGEPRRLGFF